MIETTDKAFCREISQLLLVHGVRNVVLCPGSRNAPLIVAISRQPGIKSISVIDERSAAFIALGLASISNEPVAIVCTSGSAVLNFAPAVAEAYYRRVPLIVISADRPSEWIDQDDSQTIRQEGVLSNIVKNSYNIPVETGDSVQAWYANRTINDALLMAVSEPQGPVHINVGLDAPLGKIARLDGLHAARKISAVIPHCALSQHDIRILTHELHEAKKILVIAGFVSPSERLTASINHFLESTGAVIMREAQANIGKIDTAGDIAKIDSVISILGQEERTLLLPDIVITIGGSLVSRFVKKWLRDADASMRHWHVGQQSYSVDCFMHLDKRIEMDAADFFENLTEACGNKECDLAYREYWQAKVALANKLDKEYFDSVPWTDYKAMALVLKNIPNNFNLQLSNGTAVRYAQLFDYNHIRRIDCNRGVSGIDGCASTAVGTSMAYDGGTLLVCGDMSMQYDVAALSATCVTPRLKIIVLNNSGGGIFRFVESTANLPEREEFFCCDVNLPLQDLARGYGYSYFEASDEDSFHMVWDKFIDERERPSMLNLITPPELSSEVLANYFNRR